MIHPQAIILTWYSHHIVALWGAGSAQEEFFLTAYSTVYHLHAGATLACSCWCGFIQHTDRTIFSNTIGYFIRVNPESKFTWQEPEQFLAAKSNPLCCFPNQGIHLMVDTDAAIAWSFAWLFREPVVFIMFYRIEKSNKHHTWLFTQFQKQESFFSSASIIDEVCLGLGLTTFLSSNYSDYCSYNPYSCLGL